MTTTAAPERQWPGSPLWGRLRWHETQQQLAHSDARFRVVAAGRRSGKTMLAKRALVQACTINVPCVMRPIFAACAPTRQQAKDLYWDDLIDMATYMPGSRPGAWLEGQPTVQDLTIRFITGAMLRVVGLDKPQRIEGQPLDGVVIDEYADTKEFAWPRTIRPMLSTPGRAGWAWFIGRPRGRGHFYELWQRAHSLPDWQAFHWVSAGVVDAKEIEAARRDMDELSFRQEYLAEWIAYSGLAYYKWDRGKHGVRKLPYDPLLPLCFCFDFNVQPGVAAVIQEHPLPADFCGNCLKPAKTWELCPHCKVPAPPLNTTCIIGAVWIPTDSNVERVCARLVQDWGPNGRNHRGPIHLFGDATGGQRHVAGVLGSAWTLIEKYLRAAFPQRVLSWVKPSNPPERDRVDAMNARLCTADGVVRMLVDPNGPDAEYVMRDFEGTMLLPGGSGEIHKPKGTIYSHMSDGIGYYVEQLHPLGGRRVAVH